MVDQVQHQPVRPKAGPMDGRCCLWVEVEVGHTFHHIIPYSCYQSRSPFACTPHPERPPPLPVTSPHFPSLPLQHDWNLEEVLGVRLSQMPPPLLPGQSTAGPGPMSAAAAGQTSPMLRLPAESPLAGAMGVLQVRRWKGSGSGQWGSLEGQGSSRSDVVHAAAACRITLGGGDGRAAGVFRARGKGLVGY